MFCNVLSALISLHSVWPSISGITMSLIIMFGGCFRAPQGLSAVGDGRDHVMLLFQQIL